MGENLDKLLSNNFLQLINSVVYNSPIKSSNGSQTYNTSFLKTF